MADEMDEFAQTRGADDLFDDEIIPVPAEEQQQVEPEIRAVEESVPTTVATAVQHETATPTRSDTPVRSRGGERRGGRGRGRGRGGRGGAAQTSGPKRMDGPKNKTGDSPVEAEAQNKEDKTTDTPTETTEQPTKDEDAPASGSPEAPRVPAVRGDRSATGGVKKPKLTEEELSKRIAAARENAAKVAAAHARAEADQASFLEREKVAEKKRKEERQNRRVMDTERERNRLRKLEALNGREWDAEKNEDQFSERGGRGQFRRGMHGGVSGYTRRDFGDAPADEESQQNPPPYNGQRGRGRGGRGGRGRGNHRGSRDTVSGDKTSNGPPPLNTKGVPSAPVINNESEFPSLPGGEKKEPEASDLDALKLKSLSPVSGATWAEQVESQRD